MSEILTSVDLTHEPGEAYHFLYASQLYGTLFAVYGKFQCTLDKDAKPETLTVGSIDLKLINYKGNINLGFSSTTKDNKPFNTLYKENDASANGKGAIYFEVQAMSSELETTVNLFKPITIKKGKNHNMIINRILTPMDGVRFEPGDMDYSLQDPNGKSYNQQSTVFDSEFKYRNGDAYFDKLPQAGMYGNLWALDLLKQAEVDPVVASPRCHQSNVYLVHK